MPFYPIAAAHKVCTNSMKVKYFPIKPFHKYDKINDYKLHIFYEYIPSSFAYNSYIHFIHIDEKEDISS